MNRPTSYFWDMTGRALVILVICFSLSITHAYAHCAPSGWCYPPDCCDPSGQECDPIPAAAVEVVGDWYYVTLTPQDHKYVKETTIYKMHKNYPKLRPSGDGEYHACIGVNGLQMYCLFLGVQG